MINPLHAPEIEHPLTMVQLFMQDQVRRGTTIEKASNTACGVFHGSVAAAINAQAAGLLRIKPYIPAEPLMSPEALIASSLANATSQVVAKTRPKAEKAPRPSRSKSKDPRVDPSIQAAKDFARRNKSN